MDPEQRTDRQSKQAEGTTDKSEGAEVPMAEMAREEEERARKGR